MMCYLKADCTIQVILPTSNKQNFLAMFLTKDAYYNANISEYNGKVFKKGYAYEFVEEDNKHGMSSVQIAFVAEQSIHDLMLSQENDILLQDICKDLQIKRLMAYGKNENDGTEETIQFNNKGKFVYESRDLYPDPFFDCHLSPYEKLNDSEECM